MGAGMQRSSMALCHRLWITGSALENGAGGKERWTSVGTPGPCPAAGNSCYSESSSNCQWYTLDHIQPLWLFQETVRGKWELKNSKLFFKLTSDYILPFPHQAEGAERGLEEISFLLDPASTFHPPTRQKKALRATSPTRTLQIPSDWTMELFLSKPSRTKSVLPTNINANKWVILSSINPFYVASWSVI